VLYAAGRCRPRLPIDSFPAWGGCGTTMFVHKGVGCVARYTIRFLPDGA
jgi:hypothetical protein